MYVIVGLRDNKNDPGQSALTCRPITVFDFAINISQKSWAVDLWSSCAHALLDPGLAVHFSHCERSMLFLNINGRDLHSALRMILA